MARQRWFYATCPLGLEEVLAGEITALGGLEVKPRRAGVSFRGEPSLGYAAVLWCRVAMRVFEEIERGRIREADDVYTVGQRVRWSKYLAPGQTFAIHAVAPSRRVRNPHYVALKLKDALVDQLREETGTRPDVDTDAPDVPLHLFVDDRVATISRDLSGHSLHKRGYRGAQHKSPLNAALAAGLLLLTGWDRRTPLCDPMCGSGTFLVEAAFLAGDRAPGLRGSFAFEGWQDTDQARWQALREDAEQRWKAGREHVPALEGADRHPAAIEIARKTIGRAELDGLIRLVHAEISDYVPDPAPGLVVTNPPYGERLADEDLQPSWHALGTFLHERCKGATAWVLAGNPELTRHLRLKAARRIPVYNGTIDCRWLSYPIRAA